MQITILYENCLYWESFFLNVKILHYNCFYFCASYNFFAAHLILLTVMAQVNVLEGV